VASYPAEAKSPSFTVIPKFTTITISNPHRRQQLDGRVPARP